MKTIHRPIAATVSILLMLLGAAVDGQALTPGTSDSAPGAPVALAVGSALPAAEFTPVRDYDIPFRYSRPVIRVGQDYRLAPSEVAQELRMVFGKVTIEGRVEGDAVAVLGPVHLTRTARVERGLFVFGGNVIIDEGASVGGDIVVAGGSLQAPNGFLPGGDYAVLGTAGLGEALQAFVPWITRGLLWGRIIVPDLGWVWGVAGVMLLLLLLLNAVFSGAVHASAEAIRERPLGVFFLGMLLFILTIPAIIILGATVIGLLVVPFVLCALLVAGLVGKAGVCRAIGYRVLGAWSQESPLGGFAAFLFGAVVLLAAYTVPVLGLLTWALTTALAMGAAAVMLRRRMRRESAAPSGEAPAAPAPGSPQDTMAADMAAPSWTAESPVSARSEQRPPTAENPAYASAYEAPPAQGTPVPPVPPVPPPPVAVAGSLGLYPRATFLDRVAAFALDALLVGIVANLAWNLSGDDEGYALLLLAYHVAFWAWKGTTLGGIVVGLRVVRMTGVEMRPVDALVRGLSSLFSIAAFGIGCFWMLQDPEKQMWHDKIAGTAVLKVPREVALG